MDERKADKKPTNLPGTDAVPVFLRKTSRVLLNLEMVKLKKISGKNVVGRGEKRGVWFLFYFSDPIREQQDHLPWIFENFTFLMQTGRFYDQTNLYKAALYS